MSNMFFQLIAWEYIYIDTYRDIYIYIDIDKDNSNCNQMLICIYTCFDVYISWGNDHCLSLNAAKTKCMIVANKGKLMSIVDPAPFNAGNSQIMFVNRFSYLGIVLDSEMLSKTPI